MNKGAKIKMLQAYQAVRFGDKGGLQTYFVDERHRTSSHGIKVANVRLEATEHGVLVYDDKCAVLVGWANIGSLEYDRESIDKPLTITAEKSITEKSKSSEKSKAI